MFKKSKILILLSLIVLIFPSTSYSYKRYNKVKKYDTHFKKYSKHFFGPTFSWHHFKAQAIAESRLKKNAISRVGAKGIMQIMPETFKEIKRKSRVLKGSREHPKWSIAAGIWYNRSLWKMWKAERPLQDRLDFMFGSYNAGKGNILKAQVLAKKLNLDPNLWSSIVKTLSSITGKHSTETIGYVKKIKHIKGVLK